MLAATFGAGQSGLHVTHDGGDSWRLLHALAERDYTRSLLVAPSDAATLFASGIELIDDPAPGKRHYGAAQCSTPVFFCSRSAA